MARASLPTLLSLDRFQKIMGVIPPHFNQATSGVLFSNGQCSDVWYQYDWQNHDQVSREALATEISNVEEELAAFLGYYPAPRFTVDEEIQYDRYIRPELWQTDMGNVRQAPKSITLRHGKFIGGGRRAVTLVGTATTAGGTLVYADLDGDGFSENARIILPTALTDVNEIHAFYPGHAGAPEWEIRTERSKTISGGNVTLNFYSWQFILESRLEAFPTADGILPVDGSLTANLLASIEIYRVYLDTSQVQSTMIWNRDAGCTLCGGSGCAACAYDESDGCLYARDAQLGIVVPNPATYANGAWTGSVVNVCRDPDFVKVYYQSGDIDQRYLAGETHDPLSERFARMIAFMATARLERPFCTCGNSAALAEWLREDLAFTPSDSGSRYTTEDVVGSPFGTHRGEVMAWMQLQKLHPDRIMRGTTI